MYNLLCSAGVQIGASYLDNISYMYYLYDSLGRLTLQGGILLPVLPLSLIHIWLNWYDYGARHYDAALGRFETVYPSAENYFKTSLYAYCGNSPISRMTWKSGNESTVRGYKFTYDGLDRMLNATYGERCV